MLFNYSSPKITLLYAGILGLMYFALSLNVILQRRAKLVGIGHSSDPNCPLFRAVRIHGNFSEFVPFLIFLLALDEVTGRNSLTLHLFGSAIVLGRLGHFLGIRKTHKGSSERTIGMMLTFITLITLSVLLIVKGAS